MKRLLLTALTLVLGLSLVACGTPAASDAPNEDKPAEGALGGSVQLANPFTDHDTLEDAVATAGFSLTLPDPMPEWVEETAYRSMGTEMLEVIGSGAENQLRIRKGPASEDGISGVTQSFAIISDENINGIDVAFSGTEEKTFLAEWQEDSYAYSVYVENGLSGDEAAALRELVAQIH